MSIKRWIDNVWSIPHVNKLSWSTRKSLQNKLYYFDNNILKIYYSMNKCNNNQCLKQTGRLKNENNWYKSRC